MNGNVNHFKTLASDGLPFELRPKESELGGEFTSDNLSRWFFVPTEKQMDQSSYAETGNVLFPTKELLESDCPLEGLLLANQYRVIRRIGAGGMGVVYEALDNFTGRLVAVKQLQPHLTLNQTAWQRFQKEARIGRKIASPYVVRFLGFESDAGRSFIISEFIEGMSLALWLDQFKILPESECIRLFFDVAKGLQSIHAVGVIHRDLKPGNILLDLPSRSRASRSALAIQQAKIADFGLACELEPTPSMTMTPSRALLGTPRYLAPEQFSDHPTMAVTTDLYALGVTMYQAVTGKFPFEHHDLWQLADQHRFQPPADPQSINPTVSSGWRTILLRLLEKQPEDRYQSAAELLQDFKQLQEKISIP